MSGLGSSSDFLLDLRAHLQQACDTAAAASAVDASRKTGMMSRMDAWVSTELTLQCHNAGHHILKATMPLLALNTCIKREATARIGQPAGLSIT